jgi:uncharacterized coiled-coil DUF342 family protein
LGKAKEEHQQLRAQKGALIDAKKSIRERLNVVRGQADQLANDRKQGKTGVRFHNLADIEAEISKMERRQETTSMSLSEEKKLIKEMDALKASKSLVADLKSKETDLEGCKEQRKVIQAELNAKDKEIDELQVEIDAKNEIITAMAEKETDKR